MVEDLTIDHGVSDQGLKTRTGAQVVVTHTHSDRRFQGRGCLRYASKHMHSRARSNQCAPLRGRAGQEGFPTEGCLMVRPTNNDARRGTLLRFGHRASASSDLHERWSSIQPGRVPAPLCGMLLPFQAIPTQRTIDIENGVRGRQHAGHIQRLARQPYCGSRRAHRSWSGE